MDRLGPYLSDVHRTWLAHAGSGARQREQDGSLLFLDITGFTPLTERLAKRGKGGVEQLVDTLNGVVAPLVDTAAALGGDTLKFGGDALLLLFTGDEHERRAAAAGFDMQRRMDAYRRIKTGAGTASLRASAAVASGPVHLFLVGDPFRELLVAGPLVSHTIELQSAAKAGEVLVARRTRLALEVLCRGTDRGDGVGSLAARPDVRHAGPRQASYGDAVCAGGLPAALYDHLGSEAESEHRQVTVGFAHFRGLDELVARGGPAAMAELHELMVRVAGACERYGVTFLSTDVDCGAGKVVMATGAPTASIDDVDRMLVALREVVTHEGSLRLRAGVHRGRAFVVHMGSPQRCTYTTMGDTVILAARVMGKAADGTVLATRAVVDQARAPFGFQAVQPFAVKGKRALIDGAVVGPPGVFASGAEATTPLAGRHAELGILRDTIACARGGSGRILELVGEPGIGKSRLVAETAAAARDSGMRVVVIEASSYAMATPYEALRGPLRALLAAEDDSEAELIYALSAKVRAHLPGSRGLLPLIGLAFGLRLAPTKESSRMSSHLRRSQLHYLVDRLLAAILVPRETLLVVEDAHWLDEASRDLLSTLLRRASERAWAVVVTRRPAADDLGELIEPSTRIELQPLAEDAARSLVATNGGATLGPHVVSALVARSHGNPLFLRELVAAAAQGVETDELPATVEALLTARIDTLMPVDRRLLRRASVLGQRFDLSLLREMVGARDDELHAALGRLADFLAVDADSVRFRHALHRETAYEALPFSVRRVLHAHAGELIERQVGVGADEAADILALHFLRAREYTRAYSYARAAAEYARERAAHADAAAMYRRAIAAGRTLNLDDAERASVWEQLGESDMWSGELTRANDAFTRARRYVRDDPCRESRLLHRHARAAMDGGQIVRAARWLRRGLRLLDGLGTPAAAACRATLVAELAAVRTRQARFDEAIGLCHVAIAAAGSAGAEAPLAHACYVLDWALGDAGRGGEAVHSQRALAIYRRTGDLDRESAVLNNLGIQAYREGRWDDAVGLYRSSSDAATRAGNLNSAAFGDCNVGEVRGDQGRVDEAREYLRRALDVWRGTGYQHGVAFATALAGRVEARTGHLDEALAHLESASRGFRRLHLGRDAAWVEALVAEAFVLGGRPNDARSRTQQLLDGAGRQPGALLLRVHGTALAQLEQTETARATLSAALQHARARGEEFERVLALDALLALAGDGEAAADERRRELAALVERLDIVKLPPLPLVRHLAAPTAGAGVGGDGQ